MFLIKLLNLLNVSQLSRLPSILFLSVARIYLFEHKKKLIVTTLINLFQNAILWKKFRMQVNKNNVQMSKQMATKNVKKFYNKYRSHKIFQNQSVPGKSKQNNKIAKDYYRRIQSNCIRKSYVHHFLWNNHLRKTYHKIFCSLCMKSLLIILRSCNDLFLQFDCLHYCNHFTAVNCSLRLWSCFDLKIMKFCD